MRALIAAALALVLAAPAVAQDISFDDQAPLVDALVVAAKTPGPAWWKVSDADTTVWVLGSLETSRRTPWNSSALQRRIRGADLVILPDRDSISILGIIGFFLKFGTYVYEDPPLDARLPPPLLARLKAAQSAMREPPDPRLKTLLVSMQVRRLAEGAAPYGRRAGSPEARARQLAGAARVKVEITGEDEITARFKAALTMPEADQQTCLEDALDAFDQRQTLLPALRRQAVAWADGDAPLAVVPPRVSRCVSPAAYREAQVKERTTLVAKIAEAMKTPGRVVSVIELQTLLSKDGVLDQLRAQGFEITPPSGIGDDGLPEGPLENGGMESGDL